MIELKPCPNCGSDKVGAVSVDVFSATFYEIACYECECRTQLFIVKPSAVDAWNDRRWLLGMNGGNNET